MSGRKGQIGRKKDQKSTVLLKSKKFFKLSNAKYNSGRETRTI